MFFKLFVVFAVTSLVELGILIKIGTYIGTLNTILLVVLTAAVGAYMVRMEGISVLARIQQHMQHGQFPAEELIDGAMILVAGAFLLTPGILTDTVGFLMVIPVSRNIIKKGIRQYIEKKISSGDIHINRF